MDKSAIEFEIPAVRAAEIDINEADLNENAIDETAAFKGHSPTKC